MALTLLAANNAQTVLAAGISSSATSLTVNTGTGTLFPAPVSGTSYFKLTMIDAATGTITEIVHVTARAGDVFTIQRAREGTTARAWSANDIAANMMTAGTLDVMAQKDLSLQIANSLSEIATAGNQAAGRANLGLTNPNGGVGRMRGAPKVFLSSGTYNPTPGTKSIFVEVQGAGGPGGNATNGTSTTASAGSGGGAGGYVSSWFDIVPASASVVVGAGGSTGPGGDSSFNATLQATGGGAGASNAVNGGNSYSGHARGAAGGVSSGGSINGSGGAGFPALITQGIPSGGNGGASHFSGNALSSGAAGGKGADGLLGSGGAGGAQSVNGGGYGGGKGGDGIVVVWEFA